MRRRVPRLDWFDKALAELVESVPRPSTTSHRGLTSYRFEDRSAQQAALLKLTRYISGLHAGSMLRDNGFFQELGVLQRMLDELHEDILFLSLPLLGLEKSPEHDRYLASFWEEEPEYPDFAADQRNRDQVPRKHVRAYLAKANRTRTTDHGSIATSAYLYRLYSGFTHSAAPHILEMYDPARGCFRVSGYPDSPLASAHAGDFENQLFRGIMAVFVVAQALGNAGVASEAQGLHRFLEPEFVS